MNVSLEYKIIGARHGEKLYESLLSREERAIAEDIGLYFKIPRDNRGLNYASYEVDGNQKINAYDDYTSHNAERLDGLELNKFIKEKLGDEYFAK
jgi:UDP-glucose 4-epimerase